MTNLENKVLEGLKKEREEIAYACRYASRQGWATEIYVKELKEIDELINNL